MTEPTTAGWWRAVAAVLVVVLAMAGARGASPAFAAPVEVLPGVHVPLCHGRAPDGPTVPTAPAHDCCDACALLSPAVLPSAPRPARLAAIAVEVERGRLSVRTPVPSRQRSPRQPQGPPRA